MFSREFGLACLARALGTGLACCVLLGGILGGIVHAQAPQQGTTAPVAATPALASDAAPPQGQAAAPAAADVAPGLLPRDLTPWGMFMAADLVVKAVMIGLLFASVLTWTIWFAKTLELIGARRSLARAHQVLTAARSLAEAAQPAGAASPQVARLIQAIEGELRRSPDRRDIDGLKERIAARFERIEAGVGRQMLRGTGILATIGATAPSSACSARCGAS
jgi:biopolymer transport protein ExbB